MARSRRNRLLIQFDLCNTCRAVDSISLLYSGLVSVEEDQIDGIKCVLGKQQAIHSRCLNVSDNRIENFPRN